MAKYIISLTDKEREELSFHLTSRKSTTKIYRRSLMLLAMDKNGDKAWTDSQITEAYHVSRRQCVYLRKALCEEGLERAINVKKYKKRAPTKFGAEVEAHLIALRCSSPPDGRSCWSLRLLADEMVRLEYVDSISHQGVSDLLKKTKLNLGR